MLTARGSLGVAFSPVASIDESLLAEAVSAGAGATRCRWEEGEPPGYAVTCVSELESATPSLEFAATTEEERAGLPAALNRVGEGGAILYLGTFSLADGPGGVTPPEISQDRVVGFSLGIEGDPTTADPKRMEELLRAVAAPLRAAGWQQPFWLTDLVAPEGAIEAQQGWLVRHAAHALALAMPRVFLRLSDASAAPVLGALSMLAAWLEGAERVTWLARGQYRAEYIDQPNRYLLWAAPGITRLPSSFQGPLHLRDLDGTERRVDTSRLKLDDRPVLLERRGG